MDNFTVDATRLAGFKLDLQDMGTNFSSNASRLLSAAALPVGSTGLIATLAPSFEKFQSAVFAAQGIDLTTIGTLGTNLATAATTYQATDDATSNAISAASTNAFGNSGAFASSGGDQGVSRFSGLQLPGLPEIPENSYTVRQVVTAAINLISSYDERFSEAVGVKPAADYLSPLVADWEALQAIGKRIGLLGINDYVTSENLISGTRWLQSSWSGDASQTFGASANALAQSVAGRSVDLDVVSKIVENAGACLERLVYNQAMGISGGILQPISYFEGTFPLGVWAPYINKPIRGTIRSEIASAVDTLTKSAESRRNAMTMIIEKISQALDYVPGRAVPSCNVSDFEIPDKIVVDLGVTKYGFGDNIWWEGSIGSVMWPNNSDWSRHSSITSRHNKRDRSNGYQLNVRRALMAPQIPGMPTPPPTDPGQGPHGSQPWYSRYDDYKFLDVAIGAAAGADAAGLPNAGRHLNHYLENTGKDLQLDPDKIMNDEPGLKYHVDGIVTDVVRKVASDAANYSKSISFQSEWKDYTFSNRDWYLAIGSVEACACGVVTVHSPDAEGAQPRVTLDYQSHLFDRYNWDGNKKTKIAGVEWTDRQLGALHTAGLAWEFNMLGSSTIKHHEGVLSANALLDLPTGTGQTQPR
ncbi:hypothetical protein [Nocardia sp. CA-119907]|uniref:hypothetical protein n=1 Tax=Nocardia sp. CA-119907 TaxID=3239973 RepID=UPI003D970247